MIDVRIGPDVCRDFEAAVTREWLVTNGLGGFASGTAAGANTRAYHGLLVAALDPPGQRVMLLAALEERIVTPAGEVWPLSAHEYWDGTIFPEGFRFLEAVELDGMLPLFRWTLAGRTVERGIWMEQRQNRTVIAYRLVSGEAAILRIQPLFAHRDFGASRHGETRFDVTETVDGWTVDGGGLRTSLQARPLPRILSRPDWYRRFLHRVERERGLDSEEDLFTPGAIELPLRADMAVIVAGTEPIGTGWSAGASLRAALDGQEQALTVAGVRGLSTTRLRRQLVLAADQFRVARRALTGSNAPEQRTVIAGYHWFADWGRDTMISLNGVAMATGRTTEARRILETFLDLLDQGMLPNALRDPGQPTEFNTMDATLWLFLALQAYLTATSDWGFVRNHLSRLREVIGHHMTGSRYGIHMDPTDGLLAGGAEGVALTWMDAKVGDWVVTPRRGKPIEINALWYNALQLMADWQAGAGLPADQYRDLARRARQSVLDRFWYEPGGYLYDVIDGPDGDDASLRPNQVLALALAYPLVEGEQARRVLDVVTAELLTPYGLRTLSRHDPRYQPSYRGHQPARDAAYHMGTVWPWLLGPYLDAHWRIHHDRATIARLLRPFEAHLAEAGLGTISEIFEPEPPYRPVGCIAQAWSVAELLRHAMGETIIRRRRVPE